MPLMRRKLCISIHAPTRGATKRINRGLRNLYFNPRSYKRSDLNALLKNPYVRLFQSTLLQEERRKYLRPYPRHLHFNPRSYKRSDAFSLFCQRILINISIHAPTRGATCVQFVPSKIWDISIHAPTRGATTRIILQQAICLFQSTLLQEERLCFWCFRINRSCNFNPRSYKRSDKQLEHWRLLMTYFNPRSYKRSDYSYRRDAGSRFNFNPRSYKRSDPLPRLYNPFEDNFNPRSYKRSDERK